MMPNSFRSKRSVTAGYGSMTTQPDQRDASPGSSAQPRTAPPQPGNAESPAAASDTQRPSERAGQAAAPSHDMIARLAEEIWRAKGCPVGRDEENWREAEDKLRAAARPQ